MVRRQFVKAACALLALGAWLCAGASAATVDSVCAALSGHAVTTGSFAQEKVVSGSKRRLKSSGTFVFSQQGIALHTRKPVKSSMGVTPSKLIRVTADGERTVIDNSDNAVFLGIAQTVASVFTGNKDTLEQYFTIAFDGSDAEWSMTLVPRDKTIAAALKSITLAGTVSGQDASLDRLAMENLSDGVITYTLTNQEYRGELTHAEQAFFSDK